MTDNQNPFKETENIEENKNENENIENIEESKEQIEKPAEEQVEKTDSVDEYKEKYEDLNNKYLRLAADFDNFRKRTASERESLLKYGCAEILGKLTTVLDTFDRAQEHLKNVEDCKTVKESYEVAFKQLIDTLKKAGMEEIQALGQEFNPNEHEAISQIPTNDYAPDCVAVVMQKGYKFGDKVLRPALVGVSKEIEETKEENSQEA